MNILGIVNNLDKTFKHRMRLLMNNDSDETSQRVVRVHRSDVSLRAISAVVPVEALAGA